MHLIVRLENGRRGGRMEPREERQRLAGTQGKNAEMIGMGKREEPT